DRLDPEQARAAVVGDADAAAEDAHRQAVREFQLEALAVGLQPAGLGREDARGLLDLARLAGGAGIALGLAGDDEGGVPEGDPGLALDPLLGAGVHAEELERGEPGVVDPAVAGLDPELRGQVLGHGRPAAGAPDRELADDGLAVLDGVPGPHLLPA